MAADGAPDLVDSHSHLDATEFEGDLEAVLARAKLVGVRRHVVPATVAAGWPKLREVCAGHPGLFPAYGLHPMFPQAHRPEHIAALRGWIERERPLAVGECGLDDHADDADVSRQLPYFQRQLQLAREYDLPVIVHARRAVDTVISELRAIGGMRGVVHSFGGSPEQAQRLWNLGFMIGIGGPVTHDRARRLQSLVAGMPIEYLLLETDSPDQPDAHWRGKRNEPARLGFILQTVARLRGDDPATIAAATTANAERLFRLPATG